jgi:cyclase
MVDLVKRISAVLNIPFTVGGGIRSVEEVYDLLHAGADKISVNSSAFHRPELITELAQTFGSQCIVLAVDARPEPDWKVYLKGGTMATGRDLLQWTQEAVDRGAGEILFTSMAHDGTKNGFAIEMTRTLAETLSVPIIASGGAGHPDHFTEVFTDGLADAALAASVFHFGEIPIPNLKKHLHAHGISIRLPEA